MKAALAETRLQRTSRFYSSTIGKKAVMAVTGVFLFGYVVAHLIGNLQVYSGPERINQYAELLHSQPPLLWGVRLALLAALLLHVVASIQLTRLKVEARPVGYRRKENIASSYASRTMMWSGPIILAFVIYHLLHFTTGNAHPDFRDLQPYHNVVTGFRQWPVALAYIVAMVLLGMHLYHGLWSMFQSVGVSHPGYTPHIRKAALLFAVLIVAGNVSIPLAVLLGVVR